MTGERFDDPDPYGSYLAACRALAVVETEHGKVVKTWQASCERLHEAQAVVAEARKALYVEPDPVLGGKGRR